eukprot:CAMPEP_0202028558 /NCGR_PEP_ID=MMETSP0905-20130828/63514_1 /ASSEMBLY_ACC=CAM_ASM_000554 /TAXON_ID=420261 /ORGANISM="Thalassiosira antarctica, Strain CCMP982" /LENGTH=428 /DNA_ID=CAMNT_0048592273 /DNA_START=162 /DNA_END=1449 /DNA_ORIENTATION=+
MVQEVAVAYHHELHAHRPPTAHPACSDLAPANASPSPPPPSSAAALANGRWTAEEHRLFLQGLEQYGNKGWKEIATLIQSRTIVQTRTHAQKYFKKLSKARQNGEGVAEVDMGAGIAIPVGPYDQPVVTMRTNSSGNHHHGNRSLGNDPASMAAAVGQDVGFATAAGMAVADGAAGGRKRRNAVPGGGTKRRAIGNVNVVSPVTPSAVFNVLDDPPGGGTKRRAIGNVNVVSPVTPSAVFNVLDDPYVATTIMRPPLMVAGTAASAIAKKNVTHMETLENAMFCRSRAPSPDRMNQPSHPTIVDLTLSAPSINLPIAHTQYRKAPAPPPKKAHPQGTPRTSSPTGVADMIDMSLLSSWDDNDGSAIDTLLDDTYGWDSQILDMSLLSSWDDNDGSGIDTLLDDTYRMGFPDLDMVDEQAFVDALNSRE